MDVSKLVGSDIRKSMVKIIQLQTHKKGVNSDDWTKVHINLVILAFFTIKHCKENYLPVTFTSIIRPKIPGVSKTDIHAKGRAFDLSVVGWSDKDIRFFMDTVNDTFRIGAISASDHKEREVVYEDGVIVGKGAHLHVQCRA